MESYWHSIRLHLVTASAAMASITMESVAFTNAAVATETVASSVAYCSFGSFGSIIPLDLLIMSP